MKMKTNLTLLTSIAALAISPLALAGKGGPAKGDAPEVSEVEAEVVIEQEAPIAEGETTTGENPAVCEQGGEVDPAVCEVADGEGVPIDGVKRGGGDESEVDPELMFQNTAGENPVFKGDTAISKDLGQDDKASAIEPLDGPVNPLVKREKKSPVALIKKGRVFLR